ncbi:MAG: virulence RhuM family protein [Ignavibacteria bacterium]|nr:virulence RhuM family protein [Ignavibacteria bacterium]
MDIKEKIKSLKPFDPTKYENIALDYLVMFAMNVLNNLEVPLTPENAAVGYSVKSKRGTKFNSWANTFFQTTNKYEQLCL